MKGEGLICKDDWPRPPTPPDDALLPVDYWFDCPTFRPIGESVCYWEHLKAQLEAGKVLGPMVHDARMAAICRSHGIREFWTVDRDFTRFPGLVTRNPLQ